VVVGLALAAVAIHGTARIALIALFVALVLVNLVVDKVKSRS
jgi:hypothetical protein